MSQRGPLGVTAEGSRRQLARYGAKLGGMTHSGRLAYRHELLWRVWCESPETEGEELALLELQRLGWCTYPGELTRLQPEHLRRCRARRAQITLA